jgi:Ras-related protein Rab-1A
MVYQLVKIVIIGDSSIGKSAAIFRFVKNEYDELSIPTIGVDFSIKKMIINDKQYKAHIWDLAGQERFKSIVTSYYRSAHGIVLAFDITNIDSFQNLKKWIDEINKYSIEDACMILIGTKSDLENKRQVSYDEAKHFAESQNIKYYEVSAKNNTNIEKVFIELIEEIDIKNINIKKYNEAIVLKNKDKKNNIKCC